MLHLTAFYASLLALIIIWLSYNVVTFRRKRGVDLGDGGDAEGIRHIRAQQNTLEYIPITMILFATYEINGGNHYLLHVLGIALVFARIIYPLGLVSKKGRSFGRFYGTALTWLALLFLAVANILKVVLSWI